MHDAIAAAGIGLFALTIVVPIVGAYLWFECAWGEGGEVDDAGAYCLEVLKPEWSWLPVLWAVAAAGAIAISAWFYLAES